MSRRRTLQRAGLVLGGAALGFLLVALVVYGAVRSQQQRRFEARASAALGLPDQAFDLEAVEPDGSLRILLRTVAFTDSAGNTVITAPTVRARLDARSLAGNGPIVFTDGEILRPTLYLSQGRGGDWNVFQIMKATAGGREVRAPAGRDGAEAGRPMEFRGIRIVDGTARISTPYQPPARQPTGRFASLPQPERERTAAGWVTVRTISDLDARLALVRIVPGGGYRVEVAAASADLDSPDLSIRQLAGWIEDRGDRVVRFDLDALRTEHSSFAGAGSIRLTDDGPLYDVRVTASPLDFRDLDRMGFPVPSAGTAAFDLAVRSEAGGRTRLAFTDARVAALDSRAAGNLTVTLAPGQAPVFGETRLTLDPLRLQDLETLGLVDELPVSGEVRGTVASANASAGALRLDLAATLTPRGSPDAAPSVLAAVGEVRMGTGADALRFDGLRVEARPLQLALFRSMAPKQANLLRGVVEGEVTVSGSMRAFTLAGGAFTYTVGDAPPTTLRGVSGRVALDPELTFRLDARAEPLALATLTELFPALPFRTATLAGPISVSGSASQVRFGVDLTGAAGGVQAEGTLALGGAVPRFDVSGQLEAFRAGAVLASGSPLEGPLTGTFAARGSTEDFRFDVNLLQGGGRLVLGGTVRRPGGGPLQFDVAGNVENFRIGTLVGRPGLLPGPVSGPIRLSGGGRQPYRFDVDLQGEAGRIDVEGTYAAGEVPVYTVSGAVAGLDLSALPGLAMLPSTRLTGTLLVDGRGITPETFAGRIDFNAAAGSTVGGVPLEAATARIVAADGVLRVDTLTLALRGARLDAGGTLGLTRPADEPLRFTLNAPDLSALAAFIPPPGPLEPDIAGSLAASGVVVGTIRDPSLAFRADGRGLRYQAWEAGTLAADIRARREGGRWTGNGSVEGTELVLMAGQRLETLTLEANVTPELASFGLAARRDGETDLNASGVLELAGGGAVGGAILQSFTLRAGGTAWTLADRARVAWSGERGLEIENLVLRGEGPGAGTITADGVLPPSGAADLRVRVDSMELAVLRRLAPALPDVQGRLTLDAAIEGPVGDPRLLVDARVDSLRYGGVATDSVAITARYAGGEMGVRADVRLAGRQVLFADATVPMRMDLGGIVPALEVVRTGALRAELRADSLPVALVAEAVPQLENGEGFARAQVTVTGTPDDPRVAGTATLDAAAFDVVPLGVRWHDVGARIALEEELIRVDSLGARTGDNGVANVTGTVRLDDPSQPLVYLTVLTDDFLAIDSEEVATLEVDANLNVSGRLPGAPLTGTVAVNDGTIQIPSLGEERELDIVDAEVGELGADTATAAPGGAAALLGLVVPRDLDVVIGESVWLESENARIQIGGRLGVTRAPAGEIVLTGDLEARRGTFEVSVGGIIEREFEIQSGTVQFFGTPDLNPALDIVAVHEVRARDPGESPLDVEVRLQGTLQNPRVSLSTSSRVPVPESELVSLLLFGRRSNEVLGVLGGEVLQEALVEELLTGIFAGALEQQLTRTGIVDYVRVKARPTGAGVGAFSSFQTGLLAAISVEIGKELVDDVFLAVEIAEITTNQRWGASLDWQITRTWSLRAATEPVRRDPLLQNLERRLRRNWLLEVRRRWEYGRPKVRDPREPQPVTEEPRPAEPSAPTAEPPPPPPPTTPD